jgi:hypothetical protein
MQKIKIELTVEKTNNSFWGHVKYNDNLLVDKASSLPKLETQMKNLLHNFEGVNSDEISFDHTYEV